VTAIGRQSTDLRWSFLRHGVRNPEKSKVGRLYALGFCMEALWRIRGAMRSGKPIHDAPSTVEEFRASLSKIRLGSHTPGATRPNLSPDRETPQMILRGARSVNVGIWGDFKIEGTRAGSGWRITTLNQDTGLEHEFYVQEGQIYHVQFHSPPPWSHSTGFIVGSRVRRILHLEKQAILHAVAGW